MTQAPHGPERGGPVRRMVLGAIGIACAVAAIVMLCASTADYLVLLVALGAVVFGSAAAAGRRRAGGSVRALTAIAVTLGCIVMLGQVGLSMAGMFGHEIPGYSFNSAHRPLSEDRPTARSSTPGAKTPSANPTAFSFPKGAKTQTLKSGVKIQTALGSGTVPKDAQPAKYAGKAVAIVYVRIKNTSDAGYTAGYPATYCRYGDNRKCYDVYSQSAGLTGVEPFNERVQAGKTKTFRLAYAVPAKQLGSFDLRLTLDGAANNPYIVRR